MDFVLNLKPGSLYSSGLQAHRLALEKESVRLVYSLLHIQGTSTKDPRQTRNRMTAEVYARQLVNHVTRRKPNKWFYIGHGIFFAWLVQVFFPRWLTVSFLLHVVVEDAETSQFSIMFNMFGVNTVTGGQDV